MRTLEQEVLDSSYYGTKKRTTSPESYNEWKSNMNRLGKEQEMIEQKIALLKQEQKMLEKKLEQMRKEEKELSKKDLQEEIEMLNKLLNNAESQNRKLMGINQAQETAIKRLKTQTESYKCSNGTLAEQLRVQTEEKITYQKLHEAEKKNNSKLASLLARQESRMKNPKKADGTEISLESEYAKTEYIFLLYLSGQLTTKDIAKFIKDGSIKYEIFEEIAFRIDKVDTLELVKKGLK